MRTIHRVAILATVLAAAACGGDSSTAPASQTPAASADLASSATLVCDPTFSQTKADARAFFASGSDPIFTTLRNMQSAYKTGGASAATDTGFNALQQIAAARLTSRQGGTAAAGNALTKDLLACMNVGPIPGTFDVTSALTSGIYEVRGGTSDGNGPALAQIAVAGQRSATTPVWGIETLGAWGATFAGNATRYLVYGAPLAVSSFTPDPAATDPSNAAYTGFDISTIPVMPGLALANQVRVGICINPTSGGSTNLLAHGGAAGTTVLQLSLPSFCSGVASAAPAGGFFATIAHGALSLLAPTPAYAFSIGGVGGLPSGLSPFGPVKVLADSVVLTFTQQPSNGTISAPISPAVQVTATTPRGTPIGGVQIRLQVIGNNGINAAVSNDTLETTSDLPGSAGVATFTNLFVTKAGGYTIQATGSLGGSATSSVTSVLFNVKGQ